MLALPDWNTISAALPWLLFPLVALWRARGSRSLDQVDVGDAATLPRTTVIVPARNEARNIERCMRSVLATTHPHAELIVVDDQSTDETREIAERVAREDARVRVLRTPALPEGWMGKQWACATGAAAATGDVFLFADADTEHSPDLLPRAVRTLLDWRADLLSVAGWQELGSFWERLVQPQVFSILFVRYGGTEGVNRSTRAEDKIANGQCLLMTREAYERVGGHAAVRDRVAEDLAMAQAVHRAGGRVRLVLGTAQLRTRMYVSLRELVHGWGKNIYAGGREAMPVGGLVAQLAYPILLLLAPLMGLLPPLALLFALLLPGAAPEGLLWWGTVTSAAMLLWWLAVYRWQKEPFWYALLWPLGSAVLFYIAGRAVARGRRVEWKGRAYTAR